MSNARRTHGLGPAALAATCALGVALAASVAGAQTASVRTDINATLTSPDINTKNAQVGDTFTMEVAPPYPNDDPNFAQATIRGHVAEVQSAGQGRKAQLRLAFDAIAFSNGQSQPVEGSIVKLETQNENTTARKALGAGAGMAVGSQTIGRILGGALGGVVGTLGGAVGGYLYGANEKANFDVAQGAKATIEVTSPLEVPRKQAGSS